jgi:hypothetical protein
MVGTEIRIDLAAPKKGQRRLTGLSNVPASFPITALASLREVWSGAECKQNMGKLRQHQQHSDVPAQYVSDAIIPTACI